MNGIFYKIHRAAGEGSLLAASDKEVIGKTLKQDPIHFVVSERFYKGEEISSEQLKEKMREHTSINLVGEKAVSAAIEEGLADEKQIIKIKGVKHLQIFKV